MALRTAFLFYFTFFLAGIAEGKATWAQEAPCTPIARIYDKNICSEDITLEEDHVGAIKQQFEEQGLDSDKALKNRSLERLEERLWEEALKHKFEGAKLEATESEVVLYSGILKDSLAQSHIDNKATVTKIENALAGDIQDQKQEAQLRQLLQSLRTSIAFYEEREKYNKTMPPEFHDMVLEAERGVAASMIRQWKVNKTLFEEYGGRVVLQQNTPVPIDAYKNFLDYIRSEAGLVILDRDYKDVFSVMEQSVAGSYTELPKDEQGGYQQYFESPRAQFETMGRRIRN